MSPDPTTPTPATLGALGVPDTARGFLFDLDGVLTQTAKQHAAAWKLMSDEFLAQRALCVRPEAAVVFEDALAGVAAGHAGHFGYVIGVDRVGQADALRAHGADVVGDLAELLDRA